MCFVLKWVCVQKRLGKDENSGFSGAILRFNGCCVIFPFGTIQVLRHHVFHFFRPTHLFDDLQYCKSSKIAIFWPHPPTSLMT